jgi:hypothetical protein
MQDYSNCNVQDPWLIGNGRCNNYDPHNTAECGFDGGDCDFFNKYPNCNMEFSYLLGDGNCNNYYNKAECNFDEGDCLNVNYPYCNVSSPSLVGDGNCDGGDYNTAECGFDGGDCTSGTSADNSDPVSGHPYRPFSVPVWLIVLGTIAGVAFPIGICIWKRKRNTARTKQEIAGGGAGVQTGNAKYDMNNQQETSSVQPSALPVYAFEAAPTTKPTAFCVNCGKANSKTAFCAGCGVPNGGADEAVVVGYDCTTRNQVW